MYNDKEIDVQEVQPDTKVLSEVQLETKVLSEAVDQMDKEIFFTAAMAKKKTVSVHKKKLEVEMLPIYQEINKAISAGQYSVFLKITKDQRNFLTSKNFYVSCNMSEIINGETILSCNIYWS